MKTTSKARILLGAFALLPLLGALAQSEPETTTAATSEPESVAKPESVPAVTFEPKPMVTAESTSPVKAEPEPAATPPAETVVKMAPVTATPKTPEQLYLDSVVPDPSVPYPLTVSFPSVRYADYGFYFGRTLQLEFVVSGDGVPRGFKVVTPTLDPRLANKIIDAVKTWRFSPAHRDGEAVAMRATVEARVGQQPVLAMK